jgi:ribonuclease-3
LIQAKHRVHPVYNVISIGGPDHEREFTVEVAVEENVIGRGAGGSKRIAEQAAAKFALDHLKVEEKLD